MDHDERWAAILGSELARLYLRETQTLLNSALQAARRLSDLAPRDLGNAMRVQADIGSEAHMLISAAGRLRHLLFASPRGRNESLKRFELRTRRARWLRETVFVGIDVSILDDRGVRNSIEHFDDRLDEIAERSTDGAFEFPLLVISDVALGHENALAFLRETDSPPKTVQHIRTYIADTATFHVLRWSFSVTRIAECCEEMLERLGDGWVDPRTLTVHAGSLSFQPSRPTCSRKDSGYPL